MAVHYKLSGPQFRDSAFKYELKSADQAIAQGAFTEGLDFARAAYMLAETKAEYSILLDVLVAGLEDLALARSPNPPQTPRESSWQQPLTPTTPVTPVTPSTPAGGRVGASKRYSISAGSGDKLTRDYQHLKNNVERAITQLQRKKEASLAAAAAAIKANAELTEEERKRMLLAHRTPSTQLNWQASYVTRRKDERRTQSGYGGWFGTYFRSSAIGERQSSGSSIGSASRPALQRNVSTSMEHPSPQCCVVS